MLCTDVCYACYVEMCVYDLACAVVGMLCYVGMLCVFAACMYVMYGRMLCWYGTFL